jgi:hypothetical protein
MSGRHLLLFALLASSCLAGPPEPNDSLALERNYPGAATWRIELVAGQGPQDLVSVVDTFAPFKVRGELRKPGDSCVLEPVLASLVFSPNLPKDGTRYVVKISDSLSACERCQGARKDQFVTVKAEKPASTALSVKALRKVTLTPDWKAPNLLAPSPMETREEQEKRITAFFAGRSLVFDQAYF